MSIWPPLSEYVPIVPQAVRGRIRKTYDATRDPLATLDAWPS